MPEPSQKGYGPVGHEPLIKTVGEIETFLASKRYSNYEAIWGLLGAAAKILANPESTDEEAQDMIDLFVDDVSRKRQKDK